MMQKKSSFYSILIVVCSLYLSGCAVGNKYKIEDSKIQFTSTGSSTVSVGALDQRPCVIEKTSPVTYIGMVRGGFGNPFNATTNNGLPFSDNISKSICLSLADKGYNVKQVILTPELTEEESIKRIIAQGQDKNIIVLIKKWESDVFMNFNVSYELLLKVISSKGEIIAEAKNKEEINASGSIFKEPIGLSKSEVPRIYKKSLEELLNNPRIINALK